MIDEQRGTSSFHASLSGVPTGTPNYPVFAKTRNIYSIHGSQEQSPAEMAGGFIERNGLERTKANKWRSLAHSLQAPKITMLARCFTS
jgi:hypothetical protein